VRHRATKSAMKIVVLDADPAFGSVQPDGSILQGLDESSLREIGSVTVHQRTSAEETVERAKGAEVLLTNKVILGEAELSQLPELKLISVLATGVNVVDLEAARRHGVTVCNVPGYSTAATAQHAFSLLLELCAQVGAHSAGVAKGDWENSPSFSYFRSPLLELEGLTIGIVGYGAIGQRMARLARAAGMRVLAHSRTERDLPDVTYVDKERLLNESDVISLHCPLTELTSNFIDADALGKMKSTALLVNVARGPVVDELALAKALENGVIRAAATDVLSKEPPAPENPLVNSPRCLVTPHIAWAAEAARERLLAISVENVRAFVNGAPLNIVATP